MAPDPAITRAPSLRTGTSPRNPRSITSRLVNGLTGTIVCGRPLNSRQKRAFSQKCDQKISYRTRPMRRAPRVDRARVAMIQDPGRTDMDYGLKGQVAIVTGGSRGIGRAAAAAL